MVSRAVGLIGAGNVGGRMAKDLAAAGYRVTVLDPSEKAQSRAGANGAACAADLAELVAASEIVLLSLPNSDIVDEVVAGDGGLLSLLPPGRLLVDMSTSLPARTLRLVKLCERAGVRMIDAPITLGSPHGMVIMAGGPQQWYDEAKPLFDVVGHKSTLVGPHGHGHVTKLVQNMISGVNTAIVAEAAAYAAKAGVDVGRIVEALRDTSAGSGAMARMMRRDFGDGGQLALHHKDLGYALRSGAEVGAAMPFTELLRDVFGDTLEHGDTHWSQVACVTYWERRMDVQVNAEQ
ncbi:NAD(P)-dependent oxidoreductase [Actinopolymorpha sp. B17G11]|uniref:NAD(P)-dependent oxidoreductase n=1 Tax=Actinopolymorpha sp. B17G11 TaxID=3160861 RepID=UPI0032E38A6A